MATLIAIEGADRIGKATQTKLLAEYIRQHGKSVAIVEVPVYDVLTYHIIYFMLRSGAAKRFPRTFQLLQVLNRLLFQLTMLVVYGVLFDYVVFDRWYLSTVVYGNATGTSSDFNQKITSILTRPDATIVISGPARNKETRDSYEADSDLQQRVNDGYRAWCRVHQKDSREVSSLGTPIEVHNKVTKALREMLPTL